MGAAAMKRVTAILATGVLTSLVLATPAAAVGPTEFGVYADWSVGGASGAYAAAGDFVDSAAFPDVNLASNATTVSRISGASTYYNATTDFGADFGSSRNQPYLNISTAAGQAPSTTTLTFAGDQPTGWGFALGDIDADWVLINAWADDARTIPLTIAELGFQSAQNFCTGSRSTPSRWHRRPRRRRSRALSGRSDFHPAR